MKLSRETRHAIVGLTVLAAKPAGTVMEVAQVAEEADLPAAFLAKIFHKLTHHGILTSFRGRERGYALARLPDEIMIRQVLEAIDGHDLFDRCIFWTETCDARNPCPLHDTWMHLRAPIIASMSTTSLADVAGGAGTG